MLLVVAVSLLCYIFFNKKLCFEVYDMMRYGTMEILYKLSLKGRVPFRLD